VTMIEARFSSTLCCHQRNVSPLTTPPGIPTERPATDFLRRFVDVAHHQEEQVADPERIAFPGAFDRNGRLLASTPENSVCSPRGIQPLAPPPGLRLIEAAAVMIAGYDRRSARVDAARAHLN
jgi:hypothetical protein